MMRRTLWCLLTLWLVAGCGEDFAAVPPLEPATCYNNELRFCNTGQPGPCEVGFQTCTDDQWGSCVTSVEPLPEVCDGIDNDCDGVVDNYSADCSNCLGPGVETCAAPCTAPPPGPEVCDGIDNDCDGVVDNYSADCSNCLGPGVETCAAPCTAPPPGPEVCDGIDNDCDGVVDNDLVMFCDTECGVSFSECSTGEWGACIDYVEPETCGDGVDSDCNGVDEPCPEAVLYVLDVSGSMTHYGACSAAFELIERSFTTCPLVSQGLVIYSRPYAPYGKVEVQMGIGRTMDEAFCPDGGNDEYTFDVLYRVYTDDEQLNINWPEDVSRRHVVLITDEPSSTGFISSSTLTSAIEECGDQCQLHIITNLDAPICLDGSDYCSQTLMHWYDSRIPVTSFSDIGNLQLDDWGGLNFCDYL